MKALLLMLQMLFAQVNDCPPQGEFIALDNQSQTHYIERPGGTQPVIFLHGASSNALDAKMSLFKEIPP